MSFYDIYGPRLSTAELRAKAEKFVTALKKKKNISPVQIEGKQVATTFWGKSWCQNIESYQDYASRLPRGRSYVRHGAVVDLQITRGQINAQVLGSREYKVEIKVEPIPRSLWRELCQECAGKVPSLMELLQGKLSKEVMAVLCRRPRGIFPTSREISFRCSCPDFADMCKHIAATLYGVGSRLDRDPSIFFLLRSVDEKDLIGKVSIAGILDAKPKAERRLSDDLSAVFGVDFVSDESPAKPAPTKPKAAAKKPTAKKPTAKRPTTKTPKTPPKKATRAKPKAAAKKAATKPTSARPKAAKTTGKKTTPTKKRVVRASHASPKNPRGAK